MGKTQDIQGIQRLLARVKEIAWAKQPGRCPDEYKAMQRVDAVYGGLFKSLLDPFAVQAQYCLGFHSLATQSLEVQARRAEAVRRQCDGCPEDGEEDEHVDEIQLGRSAPRVEVVDVKDILAGPRQVAWKLIQAAGLNRDQIRLVALVVQPMQDAWDRSRDVAELAAGPGGEERQSRKLPLVGTLVRLLVVGGGGCGKTLVFTKFLIPLLETRYGADGVMQEASSNKASK